MYAYNKLYIFFIYRTRKKFLHMRNFEDFDVSWRNDLLKNYNYSSNLFYFTYFYLLLIKLIQMSLAVFNSIFLILKIVKKFL